MLPGVWILCMDCNNGTLIWLPIKLWGKAYWVRGELYKPDFHVGAAKETSTMVGPETPGFGYNDIQMPALALLFGSCAWQRDGEQERTPKRVHLGFISCNVIYKRQLFRCWDNQQTVIEVVHGNHGLTWTIHAQWDKWVWLAGQWSDFNKKQIENFVLWLNIRIIWTYA